MVFSLQGSLFAIKTLNLLLSNPFGKTFPIKIPDISGQAGSPLRSANLKPSHTMQKQKHITGRTEEEIWKKLTPGLTKEPMLFQHSVLIEHNKRKISLLIDIDLGGGFESGYAVTRFIAPADDSGDFSFAIHHEGILEKIEKFFGMQDIQTGFPAFDKKFIVKSNNESKVKKIFSDKSLRDTYSSLNNFSLTLSKHPVPNRVRKKTFLELNIAEGITNPARLKKIYNAFYNTLKKV